MREHRRAALCAKDTDIKQRQARPLHQAGLRLRRRKGPLHLPGRRTPDKRTCTIGPPWRHRPLPPSDRLLQLSSQAQVYAGQAKADQALETRTCSRRDASQARSDARCHGRAPADVEHPFGTIKAWMGSTHFLTRTLKRVRTEMSLHVLAYNIKRVIALLGVGPLLKAIRA